MQFEINILIIFYPMNMMLLLFVFDIINSKIDEWHNVQNLKYISFKELDIILGYKKHEQ